MSLLVRIRNAALDNPSGVAISCSTIGEVSYSEFGDLSKQVSEQLSAIGLQPNQRVLIFMRRSGAVVIAMHAVLRAKGIYVPIYRKTPIERLKVLIEDCLPEVVLCDSDTAPEIRSLRDENSFSGEVLELDVEALRLNGSETEGWGDAEKDRDDDNFSIIYTSGSTGLPKGVMLTHGNMKHYIDWATGYFDISSNDVVFSTAPFHFDMSSFDIFASLAVGARLVIATEKECLFPKLVVNKLKQERATIWKGVSALLANISKTIDLSKVELADLRKVIFAGERLPTRHLKYWMESKPQIEYFNGYGPTEATGVSCCYRIPTAPNVADQVPIGKGRVDNEILIFDGEVHVEGPGRQGQIVINGAGVASGYWGDEEKTKKSFVDRIGRVSFEKPAYLTGDIGYFDKTGNVVFCGRNDRQIKHQGYRIELDDIEAAIHRLDGVTDAAVVYDASTDDGGLVAFYQSDCGLGQVEVRNGIASQLPGYMVPKMIHQVPNVPRNDRNKVDYQSLLEACA